MFVRYHLGALTIVDKQLDDWEWVKMSPLWLEQWERQKVYLPIKKAAKIRSALQKHASGCRRIITLQEDRYVFLKAKRNRNATLTQIAADFATASGTHVSARNISLRLNQVCLCAQKSVRCIPLQLRYRRERIHSFKECIGWSHQQ